MGSARIVLLGLLLASGVTQSARAQAEDAPAADDTAPTDTVTAPERDAAEETGYEPDQRGAIDDQPSPSPAPGQDDLADAPLDFAGEGSGDVVFGEADEEAEEQAPSFYVELSNGYAYLDPAALSLTGALASERGHHGYRLALAAGLHVSSVDTGLRVEHGFHARGVALNELALEARVGLASGDLVPQLRLALGLVLVSDLAAAAGGDANTLVGGSLAPGVGARYMLGDTLSLGAALDLGFTYTKSDGVEATGLDLKLHADVGAHF